jgi:hypothetical protein
MSSIRYLTACGCSLFVLVPAIYTNLQKKTVAARQMHQRFVKQEGRVLAACFCAALFDERNDVMA